MSDFKVLSDTEHILLRPEMYCGRMSEQPVIRFVNGNLTDVTIVPALLKCVNELIDNALDEFARSNRKAANQIKIDITDKRFTIQDNGRGIPIEKYNDQWRPALCWTAARAGTSFSADRTGAGANGVGSFIANVFSKKFIGETCDGQNTCIVECKNNMSDVDVSVMKKKGKTGTRVSFEPDFARFSITKFTDDIIEQIRERMIGIASANPEIVFKFNDETIKCKKAKDYVETYNTDYVLHESNDYFFALLPSPTDEYTQYSIIDGLEFHNGGTHEEYLSRMIAYELKDLIKKKYKLELTPAEVKRGLFVLVSGRSFENMKFDSQTKERLTNTESEVKKFFGQIPFDKLAKQIMKEDSIIGPIVEAKLAKQAAIDARAVTLAQKKLKAAKVPKHVPATGKIKKLNILYICEGDSAAGMGVSVRNVEKHGLFPVRGMPMNCYDSSHKEILENKEFHNIMSILNLQFNTSKAETIRNLQYGTIGVLCDADVDGTGAILPLLLNFFRNWPELFEEKKIKFVRTPTYIATKGKDIRYFYSKEEYEKEAKNLGKYEIRYIKGLGSLRKHEYKHCLNDEENWVTFTIDNMDSFGTMYSNKKIAERKKLLVE